MKRTTIIILLTSLVLVSGLIAAGCVQSGSDSQNTNPPGNNGGEGSQNQFRGPGFLSNATQISEAATELGVTEEVLREALNSTAGGRPNLTAAAQQLGVTRQQLTDALGMSVRGPGFLSNATQISEAATKLGVTEEVLRKALNSSTGGRPDLTAAAQQLGVTQQQLSDALGIQAGGFRGRFGNNTSTMSNP
jgi:DNA-binding phage protein